jgi:hypothetical protein
MVGEVQRQVEFEGHYRSANATHLSLMAGIKVSYHGRI